MESLFVQQVSDDDVVGSLFITIPSGTALGGLEVGSFASIHNRLDIGLRE